MSKSNLKKFFLAFLIIVFGIGISLIVKAATMVDLGTADSFAVLAGSGITDTNPSVIMGDIGLDPTGGASIPELTCAEVTGTIYDNNAGYTGGNSPGSIGCLITDDPLVTGAKADLVTAYNDAQGQVTTGVIAADLGGQTLPPGVYEDNNAPDSLSITGTLTLDAEGDPDAVFIFKSGSTLTTAVGSSVNLINGAQACNVHWQVTSSATLGVGSSFAGNILALVSITDDGGSTVDGRLLARNGAVTLNDTSITVPACASAANLHVIKIVDGGSAVAGDFSIHVRDNLDAEVTGSPHAGEEAPGTFYSIAGGQYTLSESGGPNRYTQSFSGVCNDNDTIILNPGDDVTCTITNTYHPLSSGGSSSSAQIVAPIALPAVIPVVLTQVVNTPTPSLPATGFPPKENKLLPIIIAGLSLLFISIYFVRKNKSAI